MEKNSTTLLEKSSYEFNSDKINNKLIPLKTHTKKEVPSIKWFTPLMKQYLNIKQNYKDAILFFRVGDFYEMFGEDAIKASPILEIVLTKRHNIPMCGVPYHSTISYISKLIKKGFKVAICEQMEDPSVAKGVVKREVIRIISPGTILEENLLEAKKNNYLVSIYPKITQKETIFGIAYIDISTGDFFTTEFKDENLLKLTSELTKINPSEFIFPKSFENSTIFNKIPVLNSISRNYIDDYFFEYSFSQNIIFETYSLTSLKPFGIEDKKFSVCASIGILNYLKNTQKISVLTLKPIKFYSIDEYMTLDNAAIKNLELSLLLEILDHTVTPVGSRYLRKALSQPLTNINRIKERQQSVKFFVEEGIIRRKLKEVFKSIGDLERILTRLAGKLAGPRDLIVLKNSLNLIPQIKKILKEQQTTLTPVVINGLYENLVELPNIVDLISKSIIDEPPIDVQKGNFIKPGYNKTLDELKEISQNGKKYLTELEQKEKIRTGISSLKVGYTSVFGYYIEVTKPNLGSVPKDYIRKQTLLNCERFITEELKQLEEKILSAEEKINRIELEIFLQIRNEILKYTQQLFRISLNISELDFYISLAEVAVENDYCLPEISDDYEIDIKESRHPVIEKKLNKPFVPNDVYLDGLNQQIIILTGPNMSGKSTYLRQVALIVIMAQIGSYVPAKKAHIGIVDKIFTRIGSSDNLTGGESTFMIEMYETANIINNSSSRSLLILDEVGRGTSTFDGISIAWATVEYLHKKKKQSTPGPKVLFATHYFELTELANKLDGVKNYNVSVREWQDEVIFLHKILPGCSDKSYGIYVAKLAGLPDELIKRAKEILEKLETKFQIKSKVLLTENTKVENQLDLFQKQHNIEN